MYSLYTANWINGPVPPIPKFIDVRPNGVWQKDHVYDFTLDKSKAQKLGSCVYFVPKKKFVLHTYFLY